MLPEELMVRRLKNFVKELDTSLKTKLYSDRRTESMNWGLYTTEDLLHCCVSMAAGWR